MPKYVVARKEIHESLVEVDADSPEEAVRMVIDDDHGSLGGEVGFEYDRTLDFPTWRVETADGERVSWDPAKVL